MRFTFPQYVAAALLFCPSLIALGAATEGQSQTSAPELFLAEKKVAIVVGISDYPAESGFPRLQYAAKDAEDMADALRWLQMANSVDSERYRRRAERLRCGQKDDVH